MLLVNYLLVQSSTYWVAFQRIVSTPHLFSRSTAKLAAHWKQEHYSEDRCPAGAGPPKNLFSNTIRWKTSSATKNDEITNSIVVNRFPTLLSPAEVNTQNP